MTYDKILAYCKKNNLSLRAFEIKCGIGNGTIARWNEGSEPKLESLRKIAKATNSKLASWLD